MTSKIYHITLLILLLSIQVEAVYATAQIADILIYKNDTMRIFTNPLESFFNKDNPRPKHILGNGSWNTACWRGYRAVWEIGKGQLYLNEISECSYTERYLVYKSSLSKLSTEVPPAIIEEIKPLSNKVYNEYSFKETLKKQLGNKAYKQYGDCIVMNCLLPKQKADLNKLFKDKLVDGRVHAFWYSGKLIAPHGKLLKYVHMGYDSIYESDRVIEIKHGNLISDNVFSNQEYFTQYYHTIPNSIRSYVYNRLDWNVINLKGKKQQSVCVAFFIDAASGTTDSLKLFGDSALIPQVESILKGIEKLEPVYYHGKYCYLPIWITIDIDKGLIEKYKN